MQAWQVNGTCYLATLRYLYPTVSCCAATNLALRECTFLLFLSWLPFPVHLIQLCCGAVIAVVWHRIRLSVHSQAGQVLALDLMALPILPLTLPADIEPVFGCEHSRAGQRRWCYASVALAGPPTGPKNGRNRTMMQDLCSLNKTCTGHCCYGLGPSYHTTAARFCTTHHTPQTQSRTRCST